MHLGHEIGEVFLYREAIDFRKSIDGLSAIVEMELGKNIFSDRCLFLRIGGATK